MYVLCIIRDSFDCSKLLNRFEPMRQTRSYIRKRRRGERGEKGKEEKEEKKEKEKKEEKEE